MSCLNVGSGVGFAWEKYLRANLGDSIVLDCVDQYSPEEVPDSVGQVYKQNINEFSDIPDYISNFYIQNIEEPFDLDKRYDIVISNEVMEHLDKTDEYLKNCRKHLKPKGVLYLSVPSIGSVFGRFELLFGFQPHILEISNEKSRFGTGIFGKWGTPYTTSIHHIRGYTYRALREMLEYHGFVIKKSLGTSEGVNTKIFTHIPSLAPDILFICEKA